MGMKKPPFGGFFFPSRLVNQMTTARAELWLHYIKVNRAGQRDLGTTCSANQRPTLVLISCLDRSIRAGSGHQRHRMLAQPVMVHTSECR
jgi:hypothetical protein